MVINFVKYIQLQQKWFIIFCIFSDADIDFSTEDCHEYDIGRYVGRTSILSMETKKRLLEHTWIPPKTYDFSKDATHLKRKFNYGWLELYSPWLVYSRRLKGAFCKYCVLFPPSQSSVKGVLGSLIIRPFSKFKDMHEVYRKHVTIQWHKAAIEAANSFLNDVPVDVQINQFSGKVMEENKKIISSIISCISFCGSHDLPLRGKKYGEGVLEDLFKLRIDSGDLVLKSHLEHGKKNASYRSVGIQNEIINICADVIREDIIKEVKAARAYSILADETADISGKEQLSIGLRYFSEENNQIKEEFVGFVELKALNAESIAEAIGNFVRSQDLEPEKCVGLGFDGCSTMSGKEGGVQAILCRRYKNARYFHCSSHKLNLVVNDLNAIPEIRNTISTIKDTINFFRESVLRRNLIPNVPRLCETRWSEKHKGIRVFKEHFLEIMEALETCCTEGNVATRKSAFQLHAAASKGSFIVAIILVAKYSALLEPVVNALQSIALDVVQASQHIQRIIELLRNHRDDAENITNEILKDANHITVSLGLGDINSLPLRIVSRQQHRSNPPASNPSEFWRRSVIIPYLDSIISSLELRFSSDNTPAFALTYLHPLHMMPMSLAELKEKTESFNQFYHLEGIYSEIELWRKIWEEKKLTQNQLREICAADVFQETGLFFPFVQQALLILLALPCTTCTVERSFSSLRRIKTWLRSTMGEDRLNGLALMSVHRQRIFKNQGTFIQKVVEKFARNPRRLCFK